MSYLTSNIERKLKSHHFSQILKKTSKQTVTQLGKTKHVLVTVNIGNDKDHQDLVFRFTIIKTKTHTKTYRHNENK